MTRRVRFGHLDGCGQQAGLARESERHPVGVIILMLLLAALVVLGVVLAVAVVKWLFILAVVAALCWLILFFTRRTA
jgi:hypothetical protein